MNESLSSWDKQTKKAREDVNGSKGESDRPKTTPKTLSKTQEFECQVVETVFADNKNYIYIC